MKRPLPSDGVSPPAAHPPSAMTAADYADFLQTTLSRQTTNVARHQLPNGQTAWLKKAGPRHGAARYRLLGALAWLARVPVLRPVPNRGGIGAIAIEAERLRALAALGLRVPAVLALHTQGLLLADLGLANAPTPALADQLRDAVPHGAPAVVALWHQGLLAIGMVHARGNCLSQAFARNLVRCPDGVIGYIDFEDNPAAALPLVNCQVRDMLCYLQSTALYLHEAAAMPAAQAVWAGWVAEQPAAAQAALARTIEHLRWLKLLPQDRRWGRDLQRARAAWDLLHY